MTSFLWAGLDAVARVALVVDRLTQRGVDACAFALMRAGFSKGAIRYALAVTWVGSQGFALAVAWPWQKHRPFETAFIAVIAGLLAAMAEMDKRHDAKAERAGMASKVDGGISNFTRWIGWWQLAATAPMVVSPHHDPELVAVLTGAQRRTVLATSGAGA